MIRKFALLGVCLLSVSSCVGTEVGNPQDDESEVSVHFTAYEETQPGALTLSSGVEIDEAWFVFEDFELREGPDCAESETETEEEETSESIYAVELIGGRELPTVPMSTRPLVEYCRLKIDIGDVEADELPTGAPGDLADTSVVIRGRSASGTPFELRDDFGEEFRLDGSFGLRPGEDDLFIAFDVGGWFDADALDDADVTDGTIRVDDSNNDTLLESFREAVKTSAALFRDGNRDGALDEDERFERLAEAAEDESSDSADSGDLSQ